MINVRIKIGGGAVEDMFAAHKLIYMDADNRTEAPIKKRDSTSYAEEAGEHTDPKTVQDAFDYKVTFIIDGQDKDLKRVNDIIDVFNKKLYTQEAGSNIRTYKEVTFYNDFKPHKIVGIPEPIAECKEFRKSRNGYEFAQVELTIHVSDPRKCEFRASGTIDGGEEDCGIKLHTDGEEIYIETTRELKENEVPVLLTRGTRRNMSNHGKKAGRQKRWRSKYRWHVMHPMTSNHDKEHPEYDYKGPSAEIASDGLWQHLGYNGSEPMVRYLFKKHYISDRNGEKSISVYKCHGSYYKLTNNRPQCKITYGVAICRPRGGGAGFGRAIRVSNVARFVVRYEYVPGNDTLRWTVAV